MEHDDLENILRSRRDVPPPDNLGERIIMAAARMPQERPASFQQRLIRIFTESFLIPRPVLALSLCLVIGATIGMEVEFFNVLLQDDWSSFLYADEVWL